MNSLIFTTGTTQLYVNDSVYVSFLMALYGDSYLQIQPLNVSLTDATESSRENHA